MRLATVCLMAAMGIIAGCGEGQGVSRAGNESPEISTQQSGTWKRISKAPVGSWNPEGAFWIKNHLVVVAGSTVESWDPGRDEWKVVAEIPQAEQCEGCGYSETVVWTGEELLLWGGGFSFRAPNGRAHAGASVDLEGNVAPLPDAPIRPRWWHTAVWTGEEMIVWGGACGRHECRDGAAYDPENGSWRRIAEAPMPGYAHTAVWTGRELIVWGGSDDHESEGMEGCVTSFIAEGAAYDPATDSWSELSASPLSARGWHSAVWTGSEMIVWGGATGLGCDYGYPSDGAAYDPATDSWQHIPSSPLSGRVEASAVWTGSEMIVWGGSTHGRDITLSDGAQFSVSRNGWRMLPEAPLKSRALHAAIWTGEEMIVWGGCCYFADGAVFAPADM